MVDAAVGGILAREVAEAGDGLLTAKVEHKLVRGVGAGGFPLGVPERGWLEIKNVVGTTVVGVDFLAVRVDDFPGVARQVFAIGPDHVYLRARGVGVTRVRIQCFQAKVPTGGGSEFRGLPILS